MKWSGACITGGILVTKKSSSCLPVCHLCLCNEHECDSDSKHVPRKRTCIVCRSRTRICISSNSSMSLKCVNGKKIIGNTSASVWQKACDEGWCVTACVWRVDHQRRQRWRRRVGARRVTTFRKKYIFLKSFRHTKEDTQYLPSIRDEIEVEKGLSNQRGEI